MKQTIWIVILLALSTPLFAQDVDLGLGGDASSLLNIPAPRGNTPARGAAPAARGGTNAPVDRLVRLRQLLAGAQIQLTMEQEASLNAVLNTEIPTMKRTLQARIAELQKPAVAAGAAPTNTAGSSLPSMDELAPEITRLNDQLLGKMAAAPALSPEQQTFLKKLYKDQVKSRGGFDAIQLTLEDAGAPFSPDRVAQIRALFDEQSQARLQLLRSAPGQPPDKPKLDQLQRETLAKVLKLMNPAQRAALLAK